MGAVKAPGRALSPAGAALHGGGAKSEDEGAYGSHANQKDDDGHCSAAPGTPKS